MNVVLGYIKCLAYVKNHQSDNAKANKMKWVLFKNFGFQSNGMADILNLKIKSKLDIYLRTS